MTIDSKDILTEEDQDAEVVLEGTLVCAFCAGQTDVCGTSLAPVRV
jgi:hypothetical protein